MENLKQKILNWAGGIGFGIGSLFGGGCTEEANQFSKGLVQTGIQQAVISEVRTGIEGPRSQPVIVNVGGSQTQRNVVRDGRTNVNVNINDVDLRTCPKLVYSKDRGWQYFDENRTMWKVTKTGRGDYLYLDKTHTIKEISKTTVRYFMDTDQFFYVDENNIYHEIKR